MRPLRIAMLAYRGKPTSGGQGVYVRHLSRELRALGHRVEVFSGPPHPVLDNGIAATRLPGLELFAEPNPFRRPALRELRTPADWLEYGAMARGGFGEPLAFSLRAAWTLTRRRGEFDLVHDNQCLGYGLLALRGVPTVATVHHPVDIDRDLELAEADAPRRAELLRWYRFVAMQRKVATRMPLLLTPSTAARQSLVDRGWATPDRVRVTPVGVDTTVFRPGNGPRVAGRIVAVTSADVPLKGLADLVEAFALLADPGAELAVVGTARPDGAARVLGRTKVSFHSGLSDTALADLVRSAEIACVPSRYEGFSLPAVEAMACGTPLVATTAGALPEVVGEAGVLVPPADPPALAAALRGLLDDPAARARLAAAGPARAARFSWRACAQATVEGYEALLGGAIRC